MSLRKKLKKERKLARNDSNCLFGIHSLSFVQAMDLGFSVIAKKLHSEFSELMVEQFLLA